MEILTQDILQVYDFIFICKKCLNNLKRKSQKESSSVQIH